MKVKRAYDERKEDLSDFACRVRRQRLYLRLSQEEAAERLGLSVNFYGKVERGIHGLSYASLKKMKEVFHISIDYLLTGEVENRGDLPVLKLLNEAPEEKRECLEEIIFTASRLYSKPGEKASR